MRHELAINSSCGNYKIIYLDISVAFASSVGFGSEKNSVLGSYIFIFTIYQGHKIKQNCLAVDTFPKKSKYMYINNVIRNYLLWK